MIDLGQNFRDFILEGRLTKRQVVFPTAFDARSFLKEKKQIDRHQNEAEEKTGKTEEAANAFFEKVPKLLGQGGEVAFQIGDKFVDSDLEAGSIG